MSNEFENIIIVGNFDVTKKNEKKKWIINQSALKLISVDNNLINIYAKLLEAMNWIDKDKNPLRPDTRKIASSVCKMEVFEMQEKMHLDTFIIPYRHNEEKSIYLFNEELLIQYIRHVDNIKRYDDNIIKKLKDKKNLICIHQFGDNMTGVFIKYKNIKDIKIFNGFEKSIFVMFHHDSKDKIYQAIQEYIKNNSVNLKRKINSIVIIPKQLDEIDKNFLNIKNLTKYKESIIKNIK